MRTQILRSRKKPKTRYDYNMERVRDFKVGKDLDESRMGKVFFLSIEILKFVGETPLP